MSQESDQYNELMIEIQFASGLIKKKKYTLGQYYDHMADFFDYLKMPEDAKDLRTLARKWELEKGEKSENNKHEKGKLGEDSGIF